jgi:hypothetical protein
MTFHDPQRQDEASRIRAQLEAIEIERLRLEARLRKIGCEQKPSPPASLAAFVTNESPAADKIALFRRLFAGRTDVFPGRWENPKSGRSGYAPACANEWVRGVCGKPQVRCGECPNQSFIPVTDEVIEAHLRGEDRVRHNGRGDFVAGVYPLLFDDTCRFLAVDFDDESWSSDTMARNGSRAEQQKVDPLPYCWLSPGSSASANALGVTSACWGASAGIVQRHEASVRANRDRTRLLGWRIAPSRVTPEADLRLAPS